MLVALCVARGSVREHVDPGPNIVVKQEPACQSVDGTPPQELSFELMQISCGPTLAGEQCYGTPITSPGVFSSADTQGELARIYRYPGFEEAAIGEVVVTTVGPADPDTGESSYAGHYHAVFSDDTTLDDDFKATACTHL